MRLTDHTPERVAAAFAILEDPTRHAELFPNYYDTPKGRAAVLSMAERMIAEEVALAMLWPFHAVRREAFEYGDQEWDEKGEWVRYEEHEAVVASLRRHIAVLELKLWVRS